MGIFGKIKMDNVEIELDKNNLEVDFGSDVTIKSAAAKISMDIDEQELKELIANRYHCKTSNISFEIQYNKGDTQYGENFRSINVTPPSYKIIAKIKINAEDVTITAPHK